MRDYQRNKGYRIVVLICGSLSCLAMGSIFAYGIFQPAIMDYFSLDSAGAATPFALMWMFMTIAEFIASALQKKIGAKLTAALGLSFMAVGHFGCSLLSCAMSVWLVPLYSVVVGLGIGMGYNTVAATTIKWFPDHKGLATALSLGMLGVGGALFSPFCHFLIIEAGLTFMFRVLAGIFIPCIIFALIVFVDPPKDYMNDYVPKGIVGKQTSGRECHDIKDLLRTRDAYLLVLLYFSLVPTYVIVNAVFASLGMQTKGIAPDVVAFYISVGLLAQVAGRFFITSISDKIGRKAVFFSVSILCAASTLLLIAGSEGVYVFAYCLLSLSYGGGVTCMPAIISDRLGSKNASQNIAFGEIGTLLGSLTASGLMNSMSVETAIVVSGFTMPILGLIALRAIFHPIKTKSKR